MKRNGRVASQSFIPLCRKARSASGASSRQLRLVHRTEMAGTRADRRPQIGSEHFLPPVVLLRNLEFLHRTQVAPDKPDERVFLRALGYIRRPEPV